MKKLYNEIKIELITFTKSKDVFAASDLVFVSEIDGDTTTIPGDWLL